MSKQITVQLIAINTIATPSYVRTQNGHDKESLNQLAASISQHGLLQPVVVRPMSTEEADSYPQQGFAWVIVAGRRRIAACKLAGMKEIPALIAETDETRAYELEIAENIQREQMTLADTARAVRTLMAIYDSAKKVGEVLNKSPAWVSKHLSITSSKCPAVIADLMDRGIVSDLETLILLKQIAEIPTSNPAAASTLTRMLRIANDGNMNRQIARDTLAKLKAPAQPSPVAPAVSKLTTSRVIVPNGTSDGDSDPLKTFTIELPIYMLETLERLAAKAECTPAQLVGDWIVNADSAAA